MALLNQGREGLEINNIPARSFGGCDTCRMRRVKCDETRPACFLCGAAGLPCGGYEKNLFFALDSSGGAADETNARFRRPLFTKGERERMSRWLTSKIPPKSALWHISQLEDKCEAASNKQNIDIHHGPFGAFRISQTELDSPHDSSPSGSCHDIIPSPGDATVDIPSSFFEQTSPSQSTQNLYTESSFGHSVHGHFSAADFWNTMMDTDMIQHVFETVPMADDQDASTISLDFSTTHRTTGDMGDISGHGPAPGLMRFFPLVDSHVPEDAVFLLKHYASKVVSFITPFRHSKTPWHVLFVPHAKSCLADLTIGEQPDHATLTAFYGTLAISALSLGGGAQPQIWRERARIYHQRARDHGRVMLKAAYNIPKVAKYKTILMAFQTMIQLSTLMGCLRDVEFYFLETEKFIRLRGLNRRKSRKVRILHHCYAFQRMFYESTCVSGLTSNHRRQVLEAVESSGVIIYGQDSCRFLLPDWRDLDQEMLVVKTQDEGENDLHLERPGIWTATLYPEIFGIPEVLILLLSLVIRLGKEKDAAEPRTRAKCLNLQEFLDRARVLEKCIKQMERPDNVMFAIARPPEAAGHEHLKNMVNAMQNALSIFFYRRIYDVDASILQQKVVNVRDCLLRFQGANSGIDSGSLGLVWPAFIAACEAEDPELQASFARWFENSKLTSGLDVFTYVLNTIKETWEARSSANGAGVGWVDLLKCKLVIAQ